MSSQPNLYQGPAVVEVAAAVRNAVQPAVSLCQDDWCQVDLPGHHSKCNLSNLNCNYHPTMSKDQLPYEAGDKASEPQLISECGALLGDFVEVIQAEHGHRLVNAD